MTYKRMLLSIMDYHGIYQYVPPTELPVDTERSYRYLKTRSHTGCDDTARLVFLLCLEVELCLTVAGKSR